MGFRNVFTQRHVVLPVIHVSAREQALRNVDIAREAGADGVFLINHRISSTSLLVIHREVVARHGDWWVGINCLDLTPQEVFDVIDDTVAGVWVDNARIDETVEAQPEAERILAARERRGWEGLYFGGLAFKYQRRVSDLERAVQAAEPFMDVVTTSGPGTGQAASPEKIRSMREALRTGPLAIASGITCANVRDYLDCADCFLVATGISSSFEELDRDATRALIRAVRAAD